MHPACLGLLICFFLVATDTFFLVVIAKVGEESYTKHYLCSENSTTVHENNTTIRVINDMGTCWAWNLGSTDKTCMFTLLFAATICLHIAIFAFFTGSILKCLFPEFTIVAQRSPLFRCVGRYLTVALSFAACIMGSSVLIYVSVNDSKAESSCFKTGHLWRNCRQGKDGCYLYVLLLTGCISSLVSTFLCACDARLMYITKKELDEQEKIYKSYVDYHAIGDLDSY